MNFRDRVAAFLKQHEGRWIDATEFESVGGRQAWRTRLAECRTQLGMNIENKTEHVARSDGSKWVRSRYRYTAPKGQMEFQL